MKVVTGQFDSSDYSRQPTHGVYSLVSWELLRDKAYPISLHWSYDAVIDAAARDEISGHQRVLVCFDRSMAKVSALRKQEVSANNSDFEWDDAPHYEPEF